MHISFPSLLTIFAMLAILCVSCQNNANNDHNHTTGGKSQNAATQPASPRDELFDQIMALHDEAMPKMGALRGYQKMTQARIDSLRPLKDASSQALLKTYMTLLEGLQRADKGMMDWMDEFTYHENRGSDEEVLPYYTQEKIKAKAMRDDIFTMLEKAKQLLELE